MKTYKSTYNGPIKAVIFDWAGTTVDYGCFAPTDVFLEIFKAKGIDITVEEARAPMGIMKREHIKVLCEMDRIKNLWIDSFGNPPTEKDIDVLYKDFEPKLFEILPRYSNVIDGAIEAIDELRRRNIKIGSTTGYTKEMIDIVAREASAQGYVPDSIVSSTEVPQGRPYPWMCYMNAMKLNVYPQNAMIKVGDTVSDIHEGLNAGMWSVGVILGGSELGLSQQEVKAIDTLTLQSKVEQVRKKFKEAGAHQVINSIRELPDLIADL